MKAVLPVSGLTSGKNSDGFTVLEVVIAVLLVALAGVLVVPQLRNRYGTDSLRLFLGNLNTITQYAQYNAAVTGVAHEVRFSFAKRAVSIARKTDKIDKDGKSVFESVGSGAVEDTYVWPEHVSLVNFYLHGKDELAHVKKGDPLKGDIWFYITPQGFAQSVTINCIDKDRIDESGHAKKMGLVLNPFTAVFESYDQFQKP